MQTKFGKSLAAKYECSGLAYDQCCYYLLQYCTARREVKDAVRSIKLDTKRVLR